MKTKPFDLEAALAGAPVVTTVDHLRVTSLTYFAELDDGRNFCLAGVVHWPNGPSAQWWKKEGTLDSADKTLRIAPETRKAWIIVHEIDGAPYNTHSFKTREDAVSHLARDLAANAPVVIIPIEWEV